MTALQIAAVVFVSALLGAAVMWLIIGRRLATRDERLASLQRLSDIQQGVLSTLFKQRDAAERERDHARAALRAKGELS